MLVLHLTLADFSFAEQMNLNSAVTFFGFTESTLARLHSVLPAQRSCQAPPSGLTDEGEYCKSLVDRSCSQDSQIRFDVTGYASNLAAPPVEEFKKTFRELVKARVARLYDESLEVQARARFATGRIFDFKPKNEIVDCISRALAENVFNRNGYRFDPGSFKMPSCFRDGRGREFLAHDAIRDLMTKAQAIGKDVIDHNDFSRRIKDEIFPMVKTAVGEAIVRAVPPSEGRTEMLKLISDREITFNCQSPDNEEANAYHRSAGLLPAELGVCLGTLVRCSSLFCLVHTLAHELAHAVGPCQYAERHHKSLVYVFDKLAPEEQAIAERQKQELVPKNAMDSYPLAEVVRCLIQQPQLGLPKLDSEKNICAHHHLTEFMADIVAFRAIPIFFASHSTRFGVVTADQFRQGYGNVFYATCQARARWPGARPSASQDSPTHPADVKRIALLMNSPSVRDQMACSDPPAWTCSM